MITKRALLTLGYALSIGLATPVASFADGHSDPAAELVHQYIEVVVNGRAFDRIDEFVAADVIQHNPNLPNGREALREFWSGFLGAMPDARIEVVRTISDGTFVWEHALFARGPDDPGIVAVDIYRIEDGLIVEHWDVVQEVPAETASGNHMVLEN